NLPTSTEVLDTTSGRVVSSVPGTSPVFLGDGRRIATRSPNGVKVWDTADGQLLVSLSAPGESYSYLGTSSDGRRLAAGTSNGDIRVWDAPRDDEETGGECLVLVGATVPRHHVFFRPDRHRLPAILIG